jgi:hypothetical protein
MEINFVISLTPSPTNKKNMLLRGPLTVRYVTISYWFALMSLLLHLQNAVKSLYSDPFLLSLSGAFSEALAILFSILLAFFIKA